MELEWKIFPGFTTLGILEEIQNFMTEQRCCEKNSVTVANYARRFPRGRWSFLGPGSEKNGAELNLMNQTEIGTKLLNK